MEPVTARTFANALMAAFVIHGPILMRRFDTRAICAALLFSLVLAACGGSDSDGSSASPGASNQQSNMQNSQQMAGASANANASGEDNAPGTPDMHWAPDSSASGAH